MDREFPTQEDLIMPLLQFIREHGGEIRFSADKVALLAQLGSDFNVSQSDMAARRVTPSGTKYNHWCNHVCQARRKAKSQGLIDGIVRNRWKLTPKGVEHMNKFETRRNKTLGLDRPTTP
jgi:hypothetical protein